MRQTIRPVLMASFVISVACVSGWAAPSPSTPRAKVNLDTEISPIHMSPPVPLSEEMRSPIAGRIAMSVCADNFKPISLKRDASAPHRAVRSSFELLDMTTTLTTSSFKHVNRRDEQ